MRQPDVVTSRPTPPPPEVSLRTHSTHSVGRWRFHFSTITLELDACTVRYEAHRYLVSHTYPRADVSHALRTCAIPAPATTYATAIHTKKYPRTASFGRGVKTHFISNSQLKLLLNRTISYK